MTRPRSLLSALATCLFLSQIASAQGLLVDVRPDHRVRLPRPIILPHPPRPAPTPPGSYKIESLDVNVKLADQVARVQVSQAFVNTGSRQMEVSFVFPLPYDGAVDRLTFMVDGKEHEARLLPAGDARRLYESIVRKNQDPALLEWIGTGLFKTSVFPVPPGAKRTVTLRYSQICRKSQGLTDFVFPLSTAKYTSKAVESVNIRVAVDSRAPIKNVYSPSHAVAIERPAENRAVVSFSLKNQIPTSDFRLFYDVGTDQLGAGLVSYRPTPGDDGYFLLLASPQIKADPDAVSNKNVIFVVDRSGSMSGEKIKQARGALKFVLNNLREGDAFNIIAYDSEIEAFRPELQRINSETRASALGFIEGLYAGGSTNIDEALRRAMAMLVDSERPSYVVFLTDGLPTAGETNESKIVEKTTSTNRVRARLFAFGVGYDVNSRLLDKLVRSNQGLSEYVRPNEDIEATVANLYRRIEAPVLTDVAIRVDVEGARVEQGPPISRVYPKETLDIFAGEQLVLVGRYKVSGTAKIVITGNLAGTEKRFDFPAELVASSPDSTNAFVSKLWATRRVGEIIDKLDLEGRNEELVKELVAIATKHGILTPYTSFMADETNNLRALASNTARTADFALRELSEVSGSRGGGGRGHKGNLQRARQANSANSVAPADGAYGGGMGGGMTGGGGRSRYGRGDMIDGRGSRLGSVLNRSEARGQALVGNSALAFDLDRGTNVTVTTVQLIGQKTFFYRNGHWVDASLTDNEEKNAQKIDRYGDECFKLVQTHGKELGMYLALDEPVIVKLGEKVYQW